jgi:peptide/nickel transport system substrate-binding protein
MKRRTLLAGTAVLAAPRLALSQAARPLKFVPAADLAAFDPVWTTASQTRDHGMMVYDQLYGVDDAQAVHPQMAEGHTVEQDGRQWRIVLRQGLRFHDNEPVRAADCVASIRRWAVRDAFGQELMAATDEVSAADDRTIVFRLKHPFAQLPNALAKTSSACFIMPERLARTDPFQAVTDPTGSGPFRLKLDERVPGARVVWEKFAGYQPRTDGTPSGTAGPKVAHMERIEWLIMPDGQTAAAALQRAEVDWLRWPLVDLLPQLRRARGVSVRVTEPAGLIGLLRFNHLHPPFNNVAVRRAILPAFSQAEYMQAAQGEDRELWREGAGFFTPGTPMASDAGLNALTAPRSLDAARRALAASGYGGEKVVLMQPTDFPIYNAMALVTGQLLRNIGFNVEIQAMDWATAMQRRARPDPVEQGGWNVFHTGWGGVEKLTPVTNIWLRGNGRAAAPGWPDSTEIERLRGEWLAATDVPVQQRIAAQIQRQAFIDLPYIPTGQMFVPVAHRADLQGILNGLPIFWNVRRG